MEEFDVLKNVVTPEIGVVVEKKTTKFDNGSSYIDADEEMIEIAKYIYLNTTYDVGFDINKIKYLYTTKQQKEGGKYAIGKLIARSEMEKVVDNTYDYILLVYYRTWKELDVKNKVIQLDKLLCGINVDEDGKTTKKPPDSREYIKNMNKFGSDDVLKSSELVNMTTERILEEDREVKKNLNKKQNKDGNKDETF